MKKLSVKWKFFLLFNYITVFAYLLFIASGISYLVTETAISLFDYSMMIAFIFLSLTTILNSVLNLYVLNRFYPDILIPTRTKGLMTTARIVTIILCVLLLLICIVGAYTEYTDRNEIHDNEGIYVLIICLSFWIMSLYIVILQFQLSRFLNRSNSSSINSLINSIGQ